MRVFLKKKKTGRNSNFCDENQLEFDWLVRHSNQLRVQVVSLCEKYEPEFPCNSGSRNSVSIHLNVPKHSLSQLLLLIRAALNWFPKRKRQAFFFLLLRPHQLWISLSRESFFISKGDNNHTGLQWWSSGRHWRSVPEMHSRPGSRRSRAWRQGFRPADTHGGTDPQSSAPELQWEENVMSKQVSLFLFLSHRLIRSAALFRLRYLSCALELNFQETARREICSPDEWSEISRGKETPPFVMSAGLEQVNVITVTLANGEPAAQDQ